jgi:hypothetical protein
MGRNNSNRFVRIGLERSQGEISLMLPTDARGTVRLSLQTAPCVRGRQNMDWTQPRQRIHSGRFFGHPPDHKDQNLAKVSTARCIIHERLAREHGWRSIDQGASIREHSRGSIDQGAWIREHGLGIIDQGAWLREHSPRSIDGGASIREHGWRSID